MENGTYHWTPDGGDGKKSRPKRPSGKQVGKFLIAAVAVILVLVTASTCWYTVDDKHQAVARSPMSPVQASTLSFPSAFRRPRR